MKTSYCPKPHLTSIFWLLVLGAQLFGCHDSQSAPPVPTAAEQQKLKDEQAKSQKEMNTLTSGIGKSLSKTPAAPVTDPARDWKKSHPQNKSLSPKPQTQPQSPARPCSMDKSKQ